MCYVVSCDSCMRYPCSYYIGDKQCRGTHFVVVTSFWIWEGGYDLPRTHNDVNIVMCS